VIFYVKVALEVGACNEVPEITVALNDANGTPVSVRVRREKFVRRNGSDSKNGFDEGCAMAPARRLDDEEAAACRVYRVARQKVTETAARSLVSKKKSLGPRSVTRVKPLVAAGKVFLGRPHWCGGPPNCSSQTPGFLSGSLGKLLQARLLKCR